MQWRFFASALKRMNQRKPDVGGCLTVCLLLEPVDGTICCELAGASSVPRWSLLVFLKRGEFMLSDTRFAVRCPVCSRFRDR